MRGNAAGTEQKSDASIGRLTPRAGNGRRRAVSALGARRVGHAAVAYVSIAQAADFGGEGYDASAPCPRSRSLRRQQRERGRQAGRVGFLASIGEDAAVAGDDADRTGLDRWWGDRADGGAGERAETNLTPGLAATFAPRRRSASAEEPRTPVGPVAVRRTGDAEEGV